MMCDECGIRPAAFHLAIIENGEKREKNLCGACMVHMKTYFPSVDFTGFAGLLSGLIETANQMSADAEADENMVCPHCGMGYEAFRKGGLLGCAQCYTAFQDPLVKILQRIHGHTRHAGRVPSGMSQALKIDRSIDALKEQLKKAISTEAYEEAAKLRDEIRSLSSEKDKLNAEREKVFPSRGEDT